MNSTTNYWQIDHKRKKMHKPQRYCIGVPLVQLIFNIKIHYYCVRNAASTTAGICDAIPQVAMIVGRSYI